MKKRSHGLTMVELVIAAVLFTVVILVSGSVSVFALKGYHAVTEELGSYSAEGANALEAIAQRVMRATATEIVPVNPGDPPSLIMTIPSSVTTGMRKAYVTLQGNELRYYPVTTHIPPEDDEYQVLANNVASVDFRHDLKFERLITVGNTVADGVWAPWFIFSFEGPPRVHATITFTSGVTLSTAAVPRLATRELVRTGWLSPVVTGKLTEVKSLARTYYAVVEADKIAMHTPEIFQDASGKTVYVEVPRDAAQELYKHIGGTVALMGDVTSDVAGHYAMRMNSNYAGGYVIGEKAATELVSRITDGTEAWYERETARLQPLYEVARKQGKDINQWGAAWGHLREVYETRICRKR